MELPAQMGVGERVNEAFGFFEILIGLTLPDVDPEVFVAVKVAPKLFCIPPLV
jgi:hypothetical protein